MEPISDKAILNPADMALADAPEWAPFFSGFTETPPPEVRAQIAKNFIEHISRDLGRVFKKALERAKRMKAEMR